MKQETLEESAERLYGLADKYSKNRIGFIEGAKWQQERSIPIDELLGNGDDSLDAFLLDSNEHTQEERELIMETIAEWFEQFKKK